VVVMGQDVVAGVEEEVVVVVAVVVAVINGEVAVAAVVAAVAVAVVATVCKFIKGVPMCVVCVWYVVQEGTNGILRVVRYEDRPRLQVYDSYIVQSQEAYTEGVKEFFL